VKHFLGQPILAAAGFQPAFFDRGRAGFRRDAVAFSRTRAQRSMVAPAVLPPVIFPVTHAR